MKRIKSLKVQKDQLKDKNDLKLAKINSRMVLKNSR